MDNPAVAAAASAVGGFPPMPAAFNAAALAASPKETVAKGKRHKKQKQFRAKKPKDMPRRPLSK